MLHAVRALKKAIEPALPALVFLLLGISTMKTDITTSGVSMGVALGLTLIELALRASGVSAVNGYSMPRWGWWIGVVVSFVMFGYGFCHLPNSDTPNAFASAVESGLTAIWGITGLYTCLFYAVRTGSQPEKPDA